MWPVCMFRGAQNKNMSTIVNFSQNDVYLLAEILNYSSKSDICAAVFANSL